MISYIKKWLYWFHMKRHGILFHNENDAQSLRISSRHTRYKNSGRIRVGGLVSDDVRQFIQRHGYWISKEVNKNPEFYLYDESLFLHFDAINMINSTASIPTVLLLKKAPENDAENIDINRVDAVVTCGDQALNYAKEHGWKVSLALDDYVDFIEYNPINHGNSGMSASIGIVLPRQEDSIFDNSRVKALLERWARRSDLFIWRHELGSTPNYINKNILFLQCMRGTYNTPEDIDPDVDVQVILNFTGMKSNHDFRLKHAAQGQIFADVFLSDGDYFIDDPIDGTRVSLETWLLEALENHGSILKKRSRLIRKIYSGHSLHSMINHICNHIANRDFYNPGISIIVSTNRPDYIDKILANYRRQKIGEKELIVVFHCDLKKQKVNLDEYRSKIEHGEKIKIYKLDSQEISFGYALNFAVSMTSYPYVAKFDDDDYYAENFLIDILNAFEYSDAAICGRASFHTFFEANDTLICRKPGVEYQYCTFLPGATLLIRSDVFQNVMFEDIPRDIDGRFCAACIERNYKIFTVDNFNILVMRASDKMKHTWRASDMIVANQSLPVYPLIDTHLETNAVYFTPAPSVAVEDAIKFITV